jgi:pimeloyl-ACP methyl ester carboxylesterase
VGSSTKAKIKDGQPRRSDFGSLSFPLSVDHSDMASKMVLIFSVAISLFIGSVVATASAQTIQNEEEPPPTGRMIDLGGYKLHLDCIGKGTPTVLLSIGAGGFSTDWALVQSKVAAFTRVCSYDRSGAAWSDLGPKPRSMDQEAFDLHRLLTSAGERGPYVVVGQSLGGMVVRIFAEEHPKEVVGVVLVDAYSEDAQLFTNGAMKRMRLEAKNRPIPAPRTRATAADGLTPDESQKIEAFVKQYIRNPKIDPPYDKLPECAQRVRLWAMQQPKNYAQDDDYMAEISARMYAEDQAQEHPLGSVPLVVLTRDKNKHDYQGPQTASLVKEHEEQQARMAKLSSDGKQVVVPKPGHQIELEAPEKVVAAIHDIAVYRKN